MLGFNSHPRSYLGLITMPQCLVLCLRVLFWIAVAMSTLPVLEQLRQRWLGASLAGAFANECRRRRIGSNSIARR